MPDRSSILRSDYICLQYLEVFYLAKSIGLLVNTVKLTRIREVGKKQLSGRVL